MMVTRYFTHERPAYRFLSLWITGLALNIAAWSVGYFLLPEGVARGVFPSADLPVGESGSLLTTAGPIFLFNLIVAGGIVAVANLYRVRDLPLGFFPVCFHWTLYGLFLGTDSFGISVGAKLAPSLGTLLSRSGFYEITAYTLIAAATTGIYLYRQQSWFDWQAEKVRSLKEVGLSRAELFALICAVLILALANFREAFFILRDL